MFFICFFTCRPKGPGTVKNILTTDSCFLVFYFSFLPVFYFGSPKVENIKKRKKKKKEKEKKPLKNPKNPFKTP